MSTQKTRHRCFESVCMSYPEIHICVTEMPTFTLESSRLREDHISVGNYILEGCNGWKIEVIFVDFVGWVLRYDRDSVKPPIHPIASLYRTDKIARTAGYRKFDQLVANFLGIRVKSAHPNGSYTFGNFNPIANVYAPNYTFVYKDLFSEVGTLLSIKRST